MLWLSLYENEEEKRLVEEEERAREKEQTAKEAGKRKRGHWKKRPTKKRVDKFFLSNETKASELERL